MVQELTKEADALATEAETKNKMDLLVKSNAMHLKSCAKRKKIENEEKNIDGLQKKLKCSVRIFDNLPNLRSVKIVLRSVKSQGIGKVRNFLGSWQPYSILSKQKLREF